MRKGGAMIIQDSDKVISHYGVQGMRWGVRKDRSISGQRQKGSKVAATLKKEGANTLAKKTDLKNAEWASRSIGDNLARSVAGAVAVDIFSEAVTTGDLPNVADPKWGAKMAKTALLSAGLSEIQSRNAMKRYTEEGKRDKTKKQYTKVLTPERAIGFGVRAGIVAAKLGAAMGKKKLSSVMRNKVETEARMKKWGPNILDKKTSEWQTIYDDGYMSILDKIDKP